MTERGTQVSTEIIKMLLSLLSFVSSVCCVLAIKNYPFPRNFKFATASSAYQIEGAWNQDGKGPSIWDTFAHKYPEKMIDNGDVACDSYRKYKEDVQMLKDLNVDFYRFSLSWSRLMPMGAGQLSQRGIDYYKNLIASLKANNIEPMVTLYHWDLPQTLQNMGGWMNEDRVQNYADYSRLAFTLFGADVKYWLTFNEPRAICQGGYGKGVIPPAVKSDGIMDYKCAYVVLKSHAEAYHIYDKEFRPKQKGKISFVVDTNWLEPATNSSEDIEAAEQAMQFLYGLFANPVYHPDGNFPKIVIDRVANRSLREGFQKSRLPELTPKEVTYIKGTYDFLSLNSYSTNLVKSLPEYPIGEPSFDKDSNVEVFNDPSGETASNGWVIAPWGMRKLLKWIDRAFDHPEIFITENGVADSSGTLEDDHRIKYYEGYLSSVLEAIWEDKINVVGYTAWSLMDNLEWLSGFSVKFGLYKVNFDSMDRNRTAKKSAEFYKKLTRTHCLVDSCVPL